MGRGRSCYSPGLGRLGLELERVDEEGDRVGMDLLLLKDVVEIWLEMGNRVLGDLIIHTVATCVACVAFG